MVLLVKFGQKIVEVSFHVILAIYQLSILLLRLWIE